MSNPMVSVVMITYGQEKYIKEAINSVLAQECHFEVELIIANDFSPDGTDAIIRNILKEHPRYHWIQYFNRKENIGMMPNFIDALKQTRGKYVALCEGDDYWIDPLKLQKQVDFLEANQNYSFCFHNADTIFCDTGMIAPFNKNLKPGSYTTKDLLLKGWIIPTASVMFRNESLLKTMPDWYSTVRSGDYALELLLSTHGPFYYMNEKMSVYRKNAINSLSVNSSNGIEIVKHHLSLLNHFKKTNPEKNGLATNLAIIKTRYNLMKVYIYDMLPFVVTLKNKILK
jgi:glycosyltransferase involved in cell wall biosynthesis